VTSPAQPLSADTCGEHYTGRAREGVTEFTDSRRSTKSSLQ